MKKLFVSSIFLLTILIFAGCGNSASDGQKANLGSAATSQDNWDNSNAIFFYGDGCSHCKIVEDYFRENNVGEKMQFSKKEVWSTKANLNLMLEKAKECGLDEKKLGVPLLWVEGKCYSGDKDIIQYFSDKLSSNAKN